MQISYEMVSNAHVRQLTVSLNKLAPVYLCNMFTPRTLSFDLFAGDTNQKLYLQKPRN